jgi:hypothetical protein
METIASFEMFFSTYETTHWHVQEDNLNAYNL